SSLIHVRPLPRSTLFPYTTLFRSKIALNREIRANIRDTDRSDVADREIRANVIDLDRADIGNREIATDVIQLRRTGVDDIHVALDRKSTRLNSSHRTISYAVFCLK